MHDFFEHSSFEVLLIQVNLTVVLFELSLIQNVILNFVVIQNF